LDRSAAGARVIDLADRHRVRTDPPVPFDVRRLDHPLGVVLILSGELDVAHADDFKQALARELRAGHDVILDLSQVPFIDSTGISAIVSGLAEAQDAGQTLALFDELLPQPLRLIKLVGLLAQLRLTQLDRAPTPAYGDQGQP
jgi:anti-anti-sigma factor